MASPPHELLPPPHHPFALSAVAEQCRQLGNLGESVAAGSSVDELLRPFRLPEQGREVWLAAGRFESAAVGPWGLPAVSMVAGEGVGAGDVEGHARVWLPTDVSEAAVMEVWVRSDRTRRGIGSSLVEAAARMSTQAGHQELRLLSEQPSEHSRHSVRGPDGSRHPAGQAASFAQTCGFTLGASYLQYAVPLPIDLGKVEDMVRQYLCRSGHDCRVNYWQGPAPSDALSSAQMRFEDYRHGQEASLGCRMSGGGRCPTRVEHTITSMATSSDGEPLAVTEWSVLADNPEVVHAGTTCVRAGVEDDAMVALMRLGAFTVVQRRHPGRRMVVGWDDLRDQSGRRINAAMGGKDVAIRGLWTQRLG